MEQNRLRCVIVTSQGQSKDIMCLVCFHYMTSCQMQNPLGLEDQRYVNLYVHIIYIYILYIYLQIVYYKNFVGVICNIIIIYISLLLLLLLILDESCCKMFVKFLILLIYILSIFNILGCNHKKILSNETNEEN